MIIFEDGIEAIVDQIPEIDGFKPSFHWGDKDELNRYIALQDQPYPLIWLQTGVETHINKGVISIDRDCRFILATRELEVSELNNYRLRHSYSKVLNPLLEKFIHGLKRSGITSFNSDEYKITKFPNYSEKQKRTTEDANATIDLWDAIAFDCSIKMKNINCLNQIKWQN